MSIFSTEAPQLMGVTGDTCGSCGSTTVPIYALSCHESDDFHCRDCLTQMFYRSADEVIRCPHGQCQQPTGLKPLIPLELGVPLNYDQEAIEAIRQQPEVMNNLIAFTAEEAKSIFNVVYSMIEDQTLDPVTLGGIPHHLLEHHENSLLTGYTCNPFIVGFLDQVATAPKMMTTPHDLDEDLAALLERLLDQYRVLEYPNRLSNFGFEMTSEDAAVEEALAEFKVNEIKENWELMMRKWVELVTWRHLERFS